MSEQSILNMMSARRESISSWVEQNFSSAGADQRHLDEHSSERGYWHLGYHAALIDMIALATASVPSSGDKV